MPEYGNYILRTGGGLEDLEDVFGRHLYHSRFAGRGRILDIGPGRCWFTRQNPDLIEGLDTEPEIVDHYTERGMRLTLGTVYDIPFPGATFDAVFCCWLFEHLERPARGMTEIHRVLQPNGYLCLIVPSPRTLTTTFYDDYTHVRPFTATALRQLAQDTSFSEVKVSPLFWTKGANRVTHRLGPDVAYRMLRALDRYGRAMRLVNRNNLMLEAWR